MGSSSQNTTSNTNTTTKYNQSTSPFAPQAAALDQILSGTQGALVQSNNVPLPADFIATMTPQQLDVFNRMTQGGLGMTGTGTGAAMAGGSALPYAYNNAESALTNLNGFDPSATNNAGSVLNTARQYVSGLDIPGQVRNAMLPAIQTARDVTLPGIDSSAAGTNNTDSSRTAIERGLVERGLAEQSAGLAADLGNSAWNTGTSLGEGIAGMNNTQKMGALEAALSGGIGLGNSGVLAGSTGINDLSNAFKLAGVGAAGGQQNNQLALQDAIQRYMFGVQAPFAGLDQAFPLLNSSIYGQNTQGTQNQNSTTNSTTTTNPSAFQVIGGLMGAAGSLFSPFGMFGGGMGGLGGGLTSMMSALGGGAPMSSAMAYMPGGSAYGATPISVNGGMYPIFA